MRPRPTILLVEDDHDVADAMIDVLLDQGYRVVHAPNGREALELLRDKLEPAVILLDLMMPEMDGPQFRAAQLRDPELAHIPVVIVSADRRVADTARQLGVQRFGVKPLAPEQLLELVELGSVA